MARVNHSILEMDKGRHGGDREQARAAQQDTAASWPPQRLPPGAGGAATATAWGWGRSPPPPPPPPPGAGGGRHPAWGWGSSRWGREDALPPGTSPPSGVRPHARAHGALRTHRQPTGTFRTGSHHPPQGSPALPIAEASSGPPPRSADRPGCSAPPRTPPSPVGLPGGAAGTAPCQPR